MKIAELAQRFEYYAKTHKVLKHDPDNKKERSFRIFSMESLLVANRAGLKFPCLFFKVPEVAKDGDKDNVFENIDCSFFVVVPIPKGDEQAKAEAYDTCKTICDEIFNRIYLEAADGIFEGLEVGTSEGEIGPVIDNCYGWGVTLTLQKGYDAEIQSEVWEDLQ